MLMCSHASQCVPNKYATFCKADGILELLYVLSSLTELCKARGSVSVSFQFSLLLYNPHMESSLYLTIAILFVIET